jgi:hypothetical protein
VSNGFIWLGIETGGGAMWKLQRNFGFQCLNYMSNYQLTKKALLHRVSHQFRLFIDTYIALIAMCLPVYQYKCVYTSFPVYMCIYQYTCIYTSFPVYMCIYQYKYVYSRFVPYTSDSDSEQDDMMIFRSMSRALFIHLLPAFTYWTIVQYFPSLSAFI